jgi:hypothetical protein
MRSPGSVNQSMRDMQLNSRQYFAPAVTARSSSADNNLLKGKDSMAAASSAMASNNAEKVFGSQGLQHMNESRPCPAAQLCLREAKPLFNYWLQLPQHSDMVGTILDRLVRGYVSSAKEEVVAMTWQLLSAQDKYRNPTITSLRAGNDALFQTYRRSVYGGKISAEEILANYGRASSALNQLITAALHEASVQNAVAAKRVSSAASLSTSINDAELWDLGNAKYIVTVDKVCR